MDNFKDCGVLPGYTDPVAELEIWKDIARDLDAQLTKAIIEKNQIKKQFDTLTCRLNNYIKLLESKGIS